MHSTRNKSSKGRIWLFIIILVPFLLSTMYLIAQSAIQLERVNIYFLHPTERNSITIVYYTTMFNSLLLLNVRIVALEIIRSDMATDSSTT